MRSVATRRGGTTSLVLREVRTPDRSRCATEVEAARLLLYGANVGHRRAATPPPHERYRSRVRTAIAPKGESPWARDQTPRISCSSAKGNGRRGVARTRVDDQVPYGCVRVVGEHRDLQRMRPIRRQLGGKPGIEVVVLERHDPPPVPFQEHEYIDELPLTSTKINGFERTRPRQSRPAQLDRVDVSSHNLIRRDHDQTADTSTRGLTADVFDADPHPQGLTEHRVIAVPTPGLALPERDPQRGRPNPIQEPRRDEKRRDRNQECRGRTGPHANRTPGDSH